MDVSEILIGISVFLIAFYALKVARKKPTPPGPLCLPYVGSIHWLIRYKLSKHRMAAYLMEETQKYGDIIFMKAMGLNNVFLQSYDVIHEAFVKQSNHLTDRPEWLPQVQDFIRLFKGPAWHNGRKWRALRRFAGQALRDNGLGQSTIEDKIMVEVDAVIDVLADTKGEPTDIRYVTTRLSSNVMHGIVFGSRLEFQSDELTEILDNLYALFAEGNLLDINNSVPLIVHKFLDRKCYDALHKRGRLVVWLLDLIEREIAQHEKTFDQNDIRDLVDAYLELKIKGEDMHIFTKQAMFGLIEDLFVAGSETTSNTIVWCTLYMIEFPEVQAKVQEEIDEVCGGRPVTLAIRNKLPYTEATIMEVQRISNVGDMTIPHTTEEDVWINGYLIPKHSVVHANIMSSNMDPKHWMQPHLFHPERFLDHGQLIKNPAFIPFGTGPRVCPGEALAKMEVFLTVSNILQRFEFRRENDDVRHPFTVMKDLITRAPTDFKVRVNSRR